MKKILLIAKEVAIGLCVTAVAVASAVGLGLLVKHRKSSGRQVNETSSKLGIQGPSGEKLVKVEDRGGETQEIGLSDITLNKDYLGKCLKNLSNMTRVNLGEEYFSGRAVVNFIRTLNGKSYIERGAISFEDEFKINLGDGFQLRKVKSVRNSSSDGLIRFNRVFGHEFLNIGKDKENGNYGFSCLKFIKDSFKNETAGYFILVKGGMVSLLLGKVSLSDGNTKLIHYQPNLSHDPIYLRDEEYFKERFFGGNDANSISEMYLVKKQVK